MFFIVVPLLNSNGWWLSGMFTQRYLILELLICSQTYLSTVSRILRIICNETKTSFTNYTKIFSCVLLCTPVCSVQCSINNYKLNFHLYIIFICIIFIQVAMKNRQSRIQEESTSEEDWIGRGYRLNQDHTFARYLFDSHVNKTKTIFLHWNILCVRCQKMVHRKWFTALPMLTVPQFHKEKSMK